MTKKNDVIKFDMTAGDEGYTLIPAGTYMANIDKVAIKQIAGEDRLWVGVRITGPKQASRYVTTLCTLDPTAKAAYKTRSLFSAVGTQSQSEMLGKLVKIDVVQWTPTTTGVAINDIRSFSAALEKDSQQAVMDFVNEVADSLSLPEQF